MGRERKKDGTFEPTHGMAGSRLFNVWCAMKERCNNPNNKRYKNYGGRGIKVCEEWESDFKAFYDWAMLNRCESGLTIDRIDNEKGYAPTNCRFVTRAQQNRNYSRNHMVTYNGETLCLADMANKYGINRATLSLRLKKGWDLEKALLNKDWRSNDGKQELLCRTK